MHFQRAVGRLCAGKGEIPTSKRDSRSFNKAKIVFTATSQLYSCPPEVVDHAYLEQFVYSAILVATTDVSPDTTKLLHM